MVERQHCRQNFKICNDFGVCTVCFAFAATTTLILANSKTTAEPEKADVLIVLGAGIRGDLPSVVLRNRLDRALDCYEQNPDLLIIVSGGMGEGESSTEASVMKNGLLRRAYPPTV